jgi:hypothetical protein
VSSYFFDRAEVLRAVQMIGAIMWIAYGVVLGALPVVVANVLVFSAAAWATIRNRNNVANQETVRQSG